MTIAFTCPHCGQKTDVADHFAGQSGPCAGCGRTITVPVVGTSPARLPRQRRIPVLGCLSVVAGCLALLFCSGLIVSILRPTPGAWGVMRRYECESNLEQIASAVSLYESDYGCFPPAYTTDADGNRLHSWRTLLLPYLGEEELYKKLNLEEPWDSPANRLWHDTPVDVFQCPADSSGSPTDTNYVMIVGGEGLFDGGEPLKAVDVTDGTSKTILLIEMRGTKIHWMAPEDLRWEETDFTVGGKKSISSEHEGGAHVVLCNGVVEFVHNGTRREEIRALATPTGGEKVDGFENMIEEDFSVEDFSDQAE